LESTAGRRLAAAQAPRQLSGLNAKSLLFFMQRFDLAVGAPCKRLCRTTSPGTWHPIEARGTAAYSAGWLDTGVGRPIGPATARRAFSSER
jgi:hypothetical protein